jgi:hypothetical protein
VSTCPPARSFHCASSTTRQHVNDSPEAFGHSLDEFTARHPFDVIDDIEVGDFAAE